MYGSFFIVTGFSLKFCYQESLWPILFCTVSGQSLQTMSSGIVGALRYAFQIIGISVSSIFISLMIVLVLYLTCYLLFSRKLQKISILRIDQSLQLLFLITVVVADIFLAGLAVGLVLFRPLAEYLLIIYLYLTINCAMLLALEFGMLTNKRMEAELLIMDKMLADEKKQFQISKDNIQIINLKCHDLKHQIHNLRVGEEEIDRNELKEIENAIGIYDSVARTGNDALDVILTEKSMICEKENIHLTCMAQGEKLSFISSSDIYSLFGNALDNAIEAQLKIPETERRSISFNIRENQNMLIIHMENYYEGELELEDGLPVTSKDDTEFHGFGMKSIKRIIEKYHGFMTVHAENGIFYLDIVIPISDTP
jgi:hypothetical protein